MTISKKAISKIKNDYETEAKLMLAFGKSHKTIQRWIAGNDLRLSTKTAIDVIKSTTGLKESQILSKEKQAA